MSMRADATVIHIHKILSTIKLSLFYSIAIKSMIVTTVPSTDSVRPALCLRHQAAILLLTGSVD